MIISFFAPKVGDHSRTFERGDHFIYILFTGSRALNILFHFRIKSQNNRIKETEHALFKCSNVKPAGGGEAGHGVGI